ncbi:penicillin-binding protein activator [Thiohalobacter thiocyanaticus]|uniref:penicillin-binding protein activator n=1 Tax=Thiohalobacter thiocyanaticus TaxID=585455 RepID=UPI001319C415|nr:penicillin-binding protein activator [Thiohalobacter thiocyanaticus]
MTLLSRPTPVRRIRQLLVLTALAVLAGCAGQPPREAPAPVVAPAQLPAAEARLEAGDAAGAVRLYLQAAETAPADRALDYRLQAADILIETGELEQAELLLDNLATLPPDPVTGFRLDLRRAALALARNDAAAALEQLRQAPPDAAALSAQQRYHRLRASAYTLQGQHLQSAREHIWLDGLLEAPAEREANQQAIIEALSHLNPQALAALRPDGGPVLGGWVELVQLAREHATAPMALEQALSDWRDRNPRHPVLDPTLDNLRTRLAERGRYPEQVGVILPLSGRLAEAGEAIRNGLLTAHYNLELEGPRPALRFYDIGEDPGRAWSLYQQAIREGAQFVIGPLSKDSVAQLARAGRLDVPVLALNWLPETPAGELPANLYQFSLAPEDEARQVAERAYHSGRTRALALVPEGAWGERVFSAFLERWETLGGELLEVKYYGREARALSDQVRTLLNLDASQARRTRLVRLLGRQVEFEPRRRQDAEFVFMLARPETARLLQPLFRFHHASDLALYSTSHSYEGHIDRDRDQDMNGIRFCDAPWLLDPAFQALRETTQRLWPDSTRQYPRLYAFGHDALHLLAYLSAPHAGGLAGPHAGASGGLSLDGAGRIHRDLAWARMQDGAPVALAPVFPEPGPDTGATDEISLPLRDESNAANTEPYPGPRPGGGAPRAPLPAATGAETGQP